MTRPTPPVTSDTAAWWAATRNKRLLVQRCDACAAMQLYPRALCTTCHATHLSLVESSGRGLVHSYTVVHRTPDADRFMPPYVVALVRLEEGPTLTTNIVAIDPDDVRCDLAVEVTWEPLADGRHLPLFTTPGGAATWTSP